LTPSPTPPQSGPSPIVAVVLTRTTLAAYLARSIPALDRDRDSGLIPQPCFYLRRNPRWRRDTIDKWMQAGGPSAEEWEAMTRNADGKRR
jgi:hypothetical protein